MNHDHGRSGQADPLARIRGTLVAAAWRQHATRRRRRRALAIAATVAALFGATGGALAVTDTPTGVAAIDRLLDFASQGRVDAPLRPLDDAQVPPADIRPAEGTVSAPFEVALGDDAHAVAVGYVSRAGMVCVAMADPDVREGEPRGGTGCLNPRLLQDALERSPARILGGGGVDPVNAPPISIVEGFTSRDVQRLTVIDPAGNRTEAALSRPWTPGVDYPEPIRAFLVPVELEALSPIEGGPLLAGYRFQAQLADDRSVEIAP